MRAIKNLIGTVLISIAVFLIWVLILPSYDEKVYFESATQSRLANLEEKNRLISKAEELDKEYQLRYAELKRLSLVVPPEKHLEEMITIIDDMFLAAGIPLNNIILGVQENQADYNIISTEFIFTATYDSVMNFLDIVEKSIRLIDITSLDIGISKRGDLGSGILPLDVSIKARAYFLSKTAQTKESIQSAVSEE